MRNTIALRLMPVRLRRRLVRASRGAVWGAAIGAMAALLLHGMGLDAGLIMLVSSPLIGALAGAMRSESWSRAAAAVDAHYALKDRVLTALAFSQLTDTTPLHELAIADALEHLDNIDAKRVTPLRLPRQWWSAAALFALAWLVVLWPARVDQVQANMPAPPIPGVVAEAERLEEDFAQLETLARSMDDTPMVELAKQLQDAAERMKQPDVDLKDALATLSQMQAMLMQQQAAFNLEAVDAQLGELGEALTLDDATAEAGRALKRGDYDSAAESLEGMAKLATSDQAAAALSDLANAMRTRGSQQLGDEAARMAEAMEQSDKEGFCKSCAGLAAEVRRHGQRRALAAWMRQQTARLSECKSACAACNSNGGSVSARSDNPSRNWGRGSSGNPQGDATQLDAARRREQITGQLGDGPMETETIHSPETRQIAGRDYREAYSEYRKLSEAVLESEAIPLGHRQTIRRYFEAIRPADEDAD